MNNTGDDVETDDWSKFTIFLTVLAILFWGMVIYHAILQSMPRAQYGVIFLGGTVVVYVVSELEDAFATKEWVTVGTLGTAGLVTGLSTVYLYFNFQDLYRYRTGYAYEYEYVIAFGVLAAILYLTYREFGGLFLGVILFGFVYGLFGEFFPGILGHAGFPWRRMLRISVLEFSGVYGFLNRIVATWVALFILFAGLLKEYGMFDVIQRVSFRAGRVVKSGVAQSAVIASIVIGSVNGSPTANAGMTGSFTIPMMKQSGLKPESAGGIEAVASCTGQVLPPVMGAAAFIMAGLLGITYFDVIVAGLLPAAIMIVAISFAVHFTYVGQVGDSSTVIEEFFEGREPQPHLGFAIDLSKFVIPFVVLVYFLGVAQFTVMTSALYTCVTMSVMGLGHTTLWQNNSLARIGDGFRKGLLQTAHGFREGATILAPIAFILASINILVDILLTTGVPSAISLALVELSGGTLLAAAFIAMVVSILLGLGMPTSAAYLIVALLIAPALVNQFQVPALAAHYFVFYSAVLSSITPPIAAAVAVTCGIAGAGFWRTAHEAVKIAAPLFVLPFTFIYHPELVSASWDSKTFVTLIFAFIGAIGISYGLNYIHRPYDVSRLKNYVVRGVYVALGIGIMVVPAWTVQMLLLGALGAVYTAHWLSLDESNVLPRVFRG